MISTMKCSKCTFAITYWATRCGKCCRFVCSVGRSSPPSEYVERQNMTTDTQSDHASQFNVPAAIKRTPRHLDMFREAEQQDNIIGNRLLQRMQRSVLTLRCRKKSLSTKVRGLTAGISRIKVYQTTNTVIEFITTTKSACWSFTFACLAVATPLSVSKQMSTGIPVACVNSVGGKAQSVDIQDEARLIPCEQI